MGILAATALTLMSRQPRLYCFALSRAHIGPTLTILRGRTELRTPARAGSSPCAASVLWIHAPNIQALEPHTGLAATSHRCRISEYRFKPRSSPSRPERRGHQPLRLPTLGPRPADTAEEWPCARAEHSAVSTARTATSRSLRGTEAPQEHSSRPTPTLTPKRR